MHGKHALLLLVTVAGAARADDDVEDVHVQGSRSGNFESRARLDDAPREITDAASLVEPLLGVHVRRLGADDGFATLSIRGSSSNEVAFYLAGVPLPAAADPTVDLSTLPLWPGARATVHRTFAPASLGPGSLGGTLVLEPPSPTGPERTDVWMAGGSYGTLRLRLGDVSDLGRGVRIASGLSASRSDGDFSYYNIDHNPPISDPRAFIPRVNDDFAQASGLVSLYVPIPRGSLRSTVLLQERDQGLPGTIFILTPFQRLRTDRELATVDLATRSGPGVLGAQVWGVRQGTSFHDAPSALIGPRLDDTTIVSLGGNVSYRARLRTLEVSAKLDARSERYAPGDYVGPTPPVGATRESVGAGVDADWAPWRTLSLGASARLDGWYDGSDNASLPGGWTARPNAHIGAEWRIGPVALAAHGGYTSRPANFVERFGSPGGFIPTPDLRPESAWTVDAGARFARRVGPLRLEAEVAGFAQAAQDLITFQFVGSENIPKAENVGLASLEGIEAAVRARFFGFDFRASYSGLHTENDAQCAPTCPPLPGRPAHDLVVDASYTWGPLRLRYGLDLIAGLTADGAGMIAVPDRVLQSAGIVLEVVRGVRVTFDVRNLFDVRIASYYQTFINQTVPYPIGDAYYYPLPGRNVLLSLSWQPRAL